MFLLLVRYRHEFKSNELWTEIKLVLDAFALPLTNLFKVFLVESFLKQVSCSELLAVDTCKVKTQELLFETLKGVQIQGIK